MKTMTVNQLSFAGILVVLTIAMRYGLSTLLENREFNMAWVVAATYAISVFAAGWVLGKKDYECLPLYDIGFKFHLITYLVCNVIAELWFLLGFQSSFESVKSVHLTALFWGIGLIIHLIFYLFARKDSIKGIEKSDIFD
jgi:hypothetical protein